MTAPQTETTWTTSTGLIGALAAVQAKLPRIGKARTADTGSYSYRYADLADIAAEIHPILAENGLVFIATPLEIDGRYMLCGALEHVSGQTRVGWFPLPDKASPQQIGSAITYGRRYLLCCLTGVVADDDDDGHEAAKAPAKKAAPKRQPRPAGQVTEAQLAKLHPLFNAVGLKDRDERLAFTSGLIKRDITSSNELTKDEASHLIDHLEHLAYTPNSQLEPADVEP